MQHRLTGLLSETAIYGTSSLLGRLLNYLLVPYYTSVFVPGEYGTVTEFYAYAAFLNVLYTYGLETAYFRFATKEREREHEIFCVTTSSLLLTSVLLSGVLIAVSNPLIEAIGYPGQGHYIRWFAALLAIDAFVAIPFARLRLEKKAAHFALSRIGNILINIGLNLFFLSLCPAVLEGRMLPALQSSIAPWYDANDRVGYVFLSNLIANACFLPMLWPVLRQFRWSADWGFMRRTVLPYSFPILITGLAWVTDEMLSRWALRYWLPDNFYLDTTSEEALGIFGAVYKFSVFMTLGVQAFRYAAEPFFFSKAADKDSPETFARVNHYFVIVASAVFLGVSLNLDLLKYLLRNPDYWAGLSVVPVLLLANLFLGVYYNFSIWYKLTDRTYVGTWITVGGALLTIVLNFFLIPVAGYQGSSYVTLLCYFLMAASCYLLGQKHYPIPYTIIKDGALLLLAIGLLALSAQFTFPGLWLSAIVHNGVLVAYLGLAFWLSRDPHEA